MQDRIKLEPNSHSLFCFCCHTFRTNDDFLLPCYNTFETYTEHIGSVFIIQFSKSLPFVSDFHETSYQSFGVIFPRVTSLRGRRFFLQLLVHVFPDVWAHSHEPEDLGDVPIKVIT
jgi:hypothetical protein